MEEAGRIIGFDRALLFDLSFQIINTVILVILVILVVRLVLLGIKALKRYIGHNGKDE